MQNREMAADNNNTSGQKRSFLDMLQELRKPAAESPKEIELRITGVQGCLGMCSQVRVKTFGDRDNKNAVVGDNGSGGVVKSGDGDKGKSSSGGAMGDKTDTGEAAEGDEGSYSMTVKFGSFKGAVSRRDNVIVSSNGETVLVKLTASTPKKLSSIKEMVIVPFSQVTKRMIEWVALSMGDTRTVFTSSKGAMSCYGDLVVAAGLHPTYTLREPQTFARPTLCMSLPTSAAAIPSSISGQTASPRAITSGMAPPLMLTAPPPPPGSDGEFKTDSGIPYDDPFYPVLGFHYNRTECSRTFSVDPKLLQRYYLGELPLNLAESLELEHPEIVTTPTAAKWNMTAAVNWNCVLVQNAITGYRTVNVGVLAMHPDESESLWFIHEALLKHKGNFSAALDAMAGRKFRLIHRPSPLGNPTAMNNVDSLKETCIGPMTLQVVEFGVLFKDESKFYDKTKEPANPWMCKTEEKAVAGNSGTGAKQLITKPRLSGETRCYTWGPGLDFDTAKKEKRGYHATVHYALYDDQLRRAFPSLTTTNEVWSDLAPLLLPRSVVPFECMVNVYKTPQCESNTRGWAAMMENFRLHADIIAASADIRPAILELGEPVNTDQAADALGAQPPTQNFIAKQARENTGKDLPAISIFTRKSPDRSIAVAASVGCEFRKIVARGSNRVYIFALRPVDAPTAATVAEAVKTSDAALESLKTVLRQNMFEQGGFYLGNGMPEVVDEDRVVEKSLSRGLKVSESLVGKLEDGTSGMDNNSDEEEEEEEEEEKDEEEMDERESKKPK